MQGAPPGGGGYTRRRFLRLAGGGAVAAWFAACTGTGADGEAGTGTGADGEAGTGTGADGEAGTGTGADAPPVPRAPLRTPTPTPTPTPIPPRGRAAAALLPGTPWETPLWRMDSGRAGPVVLVLGGVHGNEPGGWLAAEEIAAWEPVRGSLLVVPRANGLAVAAGERTLPELGDLNRLYPGGSAAPEPMAQMAWAIVEAARTAGASLLLDLHESWAFYAERTQDGTAFLGQTVTAGPGDRSGIAAALAEAVNAGVTVERDRLVPRDFSVAQMARAQAAGEWFPGRGGSSLSLGRVVRGLTPVLVEMGQQDQPLERRVELHRAVVRAALVAEGMLET